MWLTLRCETIASSLAQLLQAGTDRHQEQTELRIQKQPAAILPEQCPQPLPLLQKEAVAEIVSAVLPQYECFSTRGEVRPSRIRPPVLAVMDEHRLEPSALPATFYFVTLVARIASAKDHRPRHQLSDDFRCHPIDGVTDQPRMLQPNLRCPLLFPLAPHP